MTVNKSYIIGRVGQDPEIRHTQGNKMVANFSVATTEKYKASNGDRVESTEWHNIVAWGKRAEICEKYIRKGALVYVEGKLQTQSWEDERNGVKRYKTEINAMTVLNLSPKPDGDNYQSNRPQREPAKSNQNPLSDTGENPDDDELPF